MLTNAKGLPNKILVDLCSYNSFMFNMSQILYAKKEKRRKIPVLLGMESEFRLLEQKYIYIYIYIILE